MSRSDQLVRETFIATKRHDLRTPINAILGYSEMLLENARDEGNDSRAVDLEKIHAAGRALLYSVNDLLDPDAVWQSVLAAVLAASDDAGEVSLRAIGIANQRESAMIWDAATGACTQTLTGHTDWVFGLAVTSDSKTVVSGSAGFCMVRSTSRKGTSNTAAQNASGARLMHVPTSSPPALAP